MAAAILSFVSIAIFASMRMGARMHDMARMTTDASHLLQDEAERLRLLNWGAMTALQQQGEQAVSSGRARNPRNRRIDLFREVAGHPQFSDVKEITLTARWRSVDGTSNSRSVVFHYARGGVHDHYFGTTLQDE